MFSCLGEMWGIGEEQVSITKCMNVAGPIVISHMLSSLYHLGWSDTPESNPSTKAKVVTAALCSASKDQSGTFAADF